MCSRINLGTVMSDQGVHEDVRAAIGLYHDAEFSCIHTKLPDEGILTVLGNPPAIGTRRERLALSLDAMPYAQPPKVL
jgi:hypothetical protein